MGGTKKKKYERGAATAFMSRNKALRKLQLNLADFRTLCIFKGIYPVEPLHKKKVNKGSTAVKTYYNLKDIQFLAHDDLISKFREKKHYVRRLKRAMGKKNRFAESVIRDNKPIYNLTSVIRERYPTFIDALRDLDDCLNLSFVYSTFPHSKHIHVELIQLCRKRTVEFQHYVIAAKALRKVFVSIKGIYYQAEVKGETITWVVPHKRGFVHPQDVDYKIMKTFGEYYSTLLGHINIKLYTEMHLHYPPQLTDGVTPEKSNFCQEGETVDEYLASLVLPLKTTEVAVEDYEEDPEVDELNAVSADDPDTVERSKLEAENVHKIQTLFKGLKFFLNREVPREDLAFVIRSCSGSASWDTTQGPGATYQEPDQSITHHIIDRPAVSNQRLTRTYVQPQWVFDCLNAKALLPVQDYFPGVPCPPHLSPFVDEKEGEYVPEDKVKFIQRSQGQTVDHSDEEDEEEMDDSEDKGEESDNEDAESDKQASVRRKRKRNLEEESEKTIETERLPAKKSKTSKMAVMAGQIEKVDQPKVLARQIAEERKLGEMMIPKKHRRLYHKIMTSRKKSSQEARKLQEKKDKLTAAKRKGRELKQKGAA